MTDEATSRSPEPEELLRSAVTYFLSDVNTCLPGKVEEYDPAEQKVSVKPLIKRRLVTEEGEELLEELPIIPDVPVYFPRTQAFFLTFPIQVGDLVMIIFAQRSLDNWLAGQGEDTDPDEFRMHDLTDAIALPGLYPFGQAIKDIDDARVSIGKDEGGMQLHVAEDHVEVTLNSGVTLRLENKDADATLTLGDGAVAAAIADHLKTYINSLVEEVAKMHDDHTHPLADFIAPLIPLSTVPTIPGATPAPPSMKPTIPAVLSDYDDAITSSKLTFPDG